MNMKIEGRASKFVFKFEKEDFLVFPLGKKLGSEISLLQRLRHKVKGTLCFFRLIHLKKISQLANNICVVLENTVI